MNTDDNEVYIDMQQPYAQQLLTATAAALRAGAEILEVYGRRDFEVERKKDDSPLTLADRRAHELIHTMLRDRHAELPVLSEEGRDIPYGERKGWKAFWVVDPLDGTKEFVKRNGDFTVNIALVVDRVPVLGVVYVPVSDVLYFALSGCGAYRRLGASGGIGEGVSFEALVAASGRLPLRSRAEGERVKVVASRSHFTPETESFIGRLSERFGETETVNAGSSVKICLVAEGSADVYPRFGPTMEWDVAAGYAVAVEAGCEVVVPQTGEPLSFNKENLLNPWFVVGRGELVGMTGEDEQTP